MKDHAIFAGKVLLVILVMNQIAPLQAAVMKNYFATA